MNWTSNVNKRKKWDRSVRRIDRITRTPNIDTIKRNRKRWKLIYKRAVDVLYWVAIIGIGLGAIAVVTTTG